MSDDSSSIRSPRVSVRGAATVTDLATRRRSDNVLRSITLVFGGVNYGTIEVSAPYVQGQPFRLYLVSDDDAAENGFRGSVDCLVTDDATLVAAARAAR